VRVPAVVLALCLGPALGLGQSLGDAARRQADRRAGRPSEAKSYTDADLRPEEPDAAPVDVRKTQPPASATPDRRPAVTRPRPRGDGDAEDVRAQLDREAEQRKRQELLWRQRALQARARLEDAKRGHDAACGPGVLVLTGG
jgi:hypothetical protein